MTSDLGHRKWQIPRQKAEFRRKRMRRRKQKNAAAAADQTKEGGGDNGRTQIKQEFVRGGVASLS